MTDVLENSRSKARNAISPDDYAPSAERPPLAWYALFIVLFNSLFAGALGLARRAGRDIPAVGAGDVALLGVASHKLSRLIAKDKVTSPLRAPFTELEGSGGPAELEERARGTGLRKAIGELLVCPYCLGLWVAAGLSVGLVFAPRLTRLVMSLFAAVTIADFLQIAYRSGEDKGLG